ncbi:hypothetical protein EHQ76_06480 [Leptospira barantonii]|uniref:LamG domain-containing protein n=1 Tax=Leptospira barantonii TaxID=2023184 RepID=A0A5F2BPE2_9LEPT|nr:hypothetical protein [Leptospira barantonii]TGM06030.1 hypothetical protein EHQ76_06480 [Leptospira barantonii]
MRKKSLVLFRFGSALILLILFTINCSWYGTDCSTSDLICSGAGLALAGRNGVVNPTQPVSGARVWFRSDRTSTDGTSLFLQDLAGTGYSGAGNATLVEDTFNHFPAIHFGGSSTSSSMGTAPFPLGAFTIYLVFKAGGPAGTHIIYELGPDASAGNGIYLTDSNTGTIRATRAASSEKAYTPDWAKTGSTLISVHSFDGTNAGHLLFLNGTQASFVSNVFIGDPGTTNASLSLFIGSRGGVGFFATMDVAEVLIYPTAHTTSEQNTVQCYLGTRYGVGVAGC